MECLACFEMPRNETDKSAYISQRDVPTQNKIHYIFYVKFAYPFTGVVCTSQKFKCVGIFI